MSDQITTAAERQALPAGTVVTRAQVWDEGYAAAVDDLPIPDGRWAWTPNPYLTDDRKEAQR